MNYLLEQVKELIDNHVKKIVVSLLGFTFLLLLGFIYLLNNPQAQSDDHSEQLIDELSLEEDPNLDLIENEPNSEEKTEQEKSDKIVVDLKGAVQSPGVYEMKKGSRIIDCLDKAGGFLEIADQKQVNLAQILEDQMVIYVPTEGEELTQIESIKVETASMNKGSNQKEKINLNQATASELNALNGIGTVKAESIIAYREANGFFQKTEEITVDP